VTGAPRPVLEDRAAAGVLTMIAAHIGKPCPTRREVMEWTGVQRRQVWRFLGRLQARGLIQVEVMDSGTPGAPRLRRMRVTGGQWTGWTARFHDRKPRAARMMAMMNNASP
jgi:hypothetical protein